jgi:hypothetical protein
MDRSKTVFRAMLNCASETHQQTLRAAATAMETQGLTAGKLMALDAGKLVSLFISLGITSPALRVRRLPAAMNHLAALFPRAGLPVTSLAPSTQVALPAIPSLPRQFRVDRVRAWRAYKRAS